MFRNTGNASFVLWDGDWGITANAVSPQLMDIDGDGDVDLGRRSFEMTMRMNARGLLGLITLPLRPFYGMFQFRGSGPLADPTWENVMFTAPPEEQGEILKTPPKAKVVDDGG